MSKKINPFNITKAVDFTDQEIIKYWVDLTDKSGVMGIIKPTSIMPMLILGGKGSGKTHIMRYCSYELQKIRGDGNVLSKINEEGYVGIFHRSSGLNSNRFKNKGKDEEFWMGVFSYYMELWFAEMLLNIVIDILEVSGVVHDESAMCMQILDLMDRNVYEADKLDLKHIRNWIIQLRKGVDLMTNNMAIRDNVEIVEILVSPKQFVYGIPEVVAKNIVELSNIYFIYFVDELESIAENQQRYYQTLLRERSGCSTFRIGSRPSGIKTMYTMANNEENKEGSEYEKYVLDEYFRENKEAYKKFAYKICSKRLYVNTDMKVYDENYLKIKDEIEGCFEKIDEQEYCRKLMLRFDQKNVIRPYFDHLKKNLSFLSTEDIGNIIDCLKYPEDPVIEMTNIFLFYRLWKKGRMGYFDMAKTINEQMQVCLAGAKDCEHVKVLDKFKSDLISKIYYECGGEYYFSGVNSLIDMSEGIPRLFLNILKHVYRWSEFKGESPFEGGDISAEAQKRGVADAAEWFYGDADDTEKGPEVKQAINNMATFLRDVRYSDVTPECSLMAISISDADVNKEQDMIIRILKEQSFLIENKRRKEKNTKRYDRVLELNGVLATKWDLPLSKRGDLKLEKDEIDAIFCEFQSEKQKEVLKKRINKYNAPFGKEGIRKEGNIQEKLF